MPKNYSNIEKFFCDIITKAKKRDLHNSKRVLNPLVMPKLKNIIASIESWDDVYEICYNSPESEDATTILNTLDKYLKYFGWFLRVSS